MSGQERSGRYASDVKAELRRPWRGAWRRHARARGLARAMARPDPGGARRRQQRLLVRDGLPRARHSRTLAAGQWRAAAPPSPFYPDTITLVPGLAPRRSPPPCPSGRGVGEGQLRRRRLWRQRGSSFISRLRWIWHSQPSADGSAGRRLGRRGHRRRARRLGGGQRSGRDLRAAVAGPRAPREREDVRFLLSRDGDVVVGRAALRGGRCRRRGQRLGWCAGVWESIAGTGRLLPGPCGRGVRVRARPRAALAGGFEAVGPLRCGRGPPERWARATLGARAAFPLARTPRPPPHRVRGRCAGQPWRRGRAQPHDPHHDGCGHQPHALALGDPHTHALDQGHASRSSAWRRSPSRSRGRWTSRATPATRLPSPRSANPGAVVIEGSVPSSRAGRPRRCWWSPPFDTVVDGDLEPADLRAA